MPLDLNDPSKSKWTDEEIAATHQHILDSMRNTQDFMSYLQTLCPRACVVTGLARIDYELERILRKVIDGGTEVSDDRLFAPDRPLGTYSSRCEMCFRLGLIDADFLRALRLYGKMRNLYAHEFEHIDIMASPVRDWMQEIENIVSINDESTPEGLAFKKQREHPFFRFAIPLGLVLTMLMRLHFETARFRPAFVASLHIERM